MYPIPRLAALLSVAFLLAVLLAGCGGGGEESGGQQEDNGGQQEDNGGQQEGNGGQKKESKKEARETKIAVGNVVSVSPERRRMVVRPSQKVEKTDRVVLQVRKNAEITLGGQKVEVSDIAKGQQAQAEYVVDNERNRAVSVRLFKTDEQPSGGEGTSN